MNFQTVHRLESQATGHVKEDVVTRASRAIQLLPQVLRETLR